MSITTFAKVTDTLDRIALTIRPVSRLLYQWLLRKAPPGRELELELEEFAIWTGESRKRAYCLQQVKRGLQDLLAVGLVSVVKRYSSRCYKLITYRPDETLKSIDVTKKLDSETKKFKIGAAKRDCTVPNIESEETTNRVVAVGKVEVVHQLSLFDWDNSPIEIHVDALENDVAVCPSPSPVEDNIGNLDNSVTQLLDEAEDMGVCVHGSLEKLVQTSPQEVVEDAIALVKQRQAKSEVRNPTGLFIQAIKQRWKPTPQVSASQQTYPPGFLELYTQACSAGLCLDVPPNQLPIVMGEINVRVINPQPRLWEPPYILMPWTQLAQSHL